MPYSHTLTPNRIVGSRRRMTPLAVMSILLLAAVPPLRAAQRMTPIHLRIAGREVVGKTDTICDDTEVYVPLETLAALGADGKINAKGDAVLVTLLTSKRQGELALARPEGRPMLALSDLARFVNGDVERPDAVGPDGKSIPDHPGDTVYLLARVTEAHFANGALHVVTSFPVPFHVRMIADTTPPRGYVDCVGAWVADDFHPTAPASGEKAALRLRAGQNNVETARVVVELAAGNGFKFADTNVNGATEIVVNLANGLPRDRAQIADARVQASGKLDGTDAPRDQGERNQLERANVLPPGNQTKNVPPKLKTRAVPRGYTRGQKTARGGRIRREAIPVEVRALTLTIDSDSDVRLDIGTSGRANAFVHYRQGGSQLLVDIPNAFLNLNAPGDAEQTLAHPLITGLHAVLAQQSPPMTRLTLDTARVVGYRLAVQDDRLTLELRLPRSANGALADKLIVVDAGHGGTSTGAVGRGGGTVYEKDVTLAIAMKLKEDLESCGARVVMTRDRDVNVDLYARPHMANDIGADLFISIHNDSNGVPNSASGTSTYYHMGDPDSRALATCVQQAVCLITGLPSRGALSDGILYAHGLAVLRESRMPAVLCEVAYINNAYDRRKLTDPDFQQRVATAMCAGLRRYVEGSGVTGLREAPMPPVLRETPLPYVPGDTGTEEQGEN